LVASRLLAERGLIYREDLDADAARELLRSAWGDRPAITIKKRP
jgi:hypothetical protein